MDAKRMIRNLVIAARSAYRSDAGLVALGYRDTPHFAIYGHVADAIYEILDEHTDTFEESITYRTLTDLRLSDDTCVDIIFHAYEVLLAREYADGKLRI